MVNKEHLAILKSGVKQWNEWRGDNPEAIPELNGAYLSEANLTGANFGGANLRYAHFDGADLTKADLTGANLHGATLRGASLTEATLIEADLHGADLRRATLTKANLRGADLTESHLGRANLTGANLYGATLQGANFIEANLSEAKLTEADLTGVDFTGAGLRKADLSGANLKFATLGGANLNEAILIGTHLIQTQLSNASFMGTHFHQTTLVDVDLSECLEIEKSWHSGPSYLGIDTIYRSRGKIPPVFLRKAGVPDNFIEYMASLTGTPFQFYSCFISHSTNDKTFCTRLLEELQKAHVRTWLFSENAKWGESVWGEIDRGIKTYDKLMVVCSQHSLQSGPVLREIERALNREDREGKSVLFPIRIDDYIFNQWDHPRKADVLSKVVGDFTNWEHDASKYEVDFKKLLMALNRIEEPK